MLDGGPARVRAGAHGELSGGTRQRLGLAILCCPTRLCCCWTSLGLSLDPGWRKRLQDTLRVEAARGKTVLVTTHLIAEWNNVADAVFLCREGKIERELDPANLPHNFDEMETATRRCAQYRQTMSRAFPSLVNAASFARSLYSASFAMRSSIATFKSSRGLSLLGGAGARLFSVKTRTGVAFLILQVALYF